MTRAAAALLTLAAAACGGGGTITGIDAAPPESDGGFSPPPCDVQFGHSYIMTSLVMLPEGQGLDITGDGQPDNALGFLAPIANQALADGIELGTGLYLLDLTDWDGPPVATDPDLNMTFYAGIDADQPPDVSNNYDGDGVFDVLSRQFDVHCMPRGRSDESSLADGTFMATAPVWEVLVPQIGTVQFVSAQLELEFDEQLRTMAGPLGAVWPLCVLDRTSGPLFAGRSLLDQLANDFGQPEPDLDLDGDGLERVVGDGDRVVQCIDGDGTVIDGVDCGCDPRMADGYSLAIDLELAPATIRGIVETE